MAIGGSVRKKLAIVACMRRLLVWINAMTRDPRDWNPALFSKPS